MKCPHCGYSFKDKDKIKGGKKRWEKIDKTKRSAIMAAVRRSLYKDV